MIRVFTLLFPPRRPTVRRSTAWPHVRAAWLRDNPACAVCGCRRSLEVHHLLPVSLRPDLELDRDNLLTLGEACPTGNHHLLFGHFGDWRAYNPQAREDAAAWAAKLETRGFYRAGA